MKIPIQAISIRGYKSIDCLEDFALSDLNVLIGANGAGKSNFVEFFCLMNAIVKKNLQEFVERNGGVESFFYQGARCATRIEIVIRFDGYSYQLIIVPDDGRVIIESEKIILHSEQNENKSVFHNENSTESKLTDSSDYLNQKMPDECRDIVQTMSGLVSVPFS